MSQRKTVFLTNYLSPYRDSLLRPLGQLLPLEVRLARIGDAGRGWDTTRKSDSTYQVKDCKLPSTNWPIPEFWLPNPGWLDLTNVDGVIVGGCEAPAYWTIALKAKRAGLRTIGFYESTPESHVYTNSLVVKLKAKYFLSLDGVVTPGAGATQALLNMGLKRAKIFQGFNAADHAYWNEQANSERTASSGQNGHRYLYVGRLIELKGIAEIIKAFKICGRPNDTLRIVGKGPLHCDLSTLITSLDLNDSVTLLGSKSGSDLAVEYSLANTLVLASHTEVWGIVLNEALASGLHVVVTENCGAVRDIESMQGVFLVKESTEDRTSSIAFQMGVSRDEWVGWIRSPEILSKKPEDYALLFEHALSILK